MIVKVELEYELSGESIPDALHNLAESIEHKRDHCVGCGLRGVYEYRFLKGAVIVPGIRNEGELDQISTYCDLPSRGY